MKIIIRSFIAIALFLLISEVNAQSESTTIIIVRHAEKEVVAEGDKMMQADPPLSAEGKQRAENLIEALKEYTPTSVFSTNYIRTKATVTPLAGKFNLDIQSYDPRNQQVLAEKLRTMTGKTIVVAGHSNTVPGLVNLLIGSNKFENLDDAVYNKIFIVTITNGEATVEVKEY